MDRRSASALGVASLGLASLLGSTARAPSPRQAGSDPRIADERLLAEGCASCHPAIVESYLRGAMARALEPLAEGEAAALAELAGVDEPGTGYHYRFEERDGRARLVESWTLAAEEGENDGVHERRASAELDFAVGAGLFDRAFAARRGGEWFFAPLEVITGHGSGAHAALAPALQQVPGTRFTQPLTVECLGCHSDAPPAQVYPLNEALAGWQPRGISCAACHGDVAGHRAWREAELAGEGPGDGVGDRDPITTSRTLARSERLSVCARCHLQGDARLRLGGASGSLPPVGEDLLQHLAVFTAAAQGDEIGFVSHVERLVRSPCFQASERLGQRAMVCETCHDPHRSMLGDARERRAVRDGCLGCHPASASEPARDAQACSRPDPAGPGDCVDCHMRRTAVFDLAGVEITDHDIRRRPAAASRFAAIRAKQAVVPELARFHWPGAAEPPHAGDPGLEMMALAAASQPAAALERVDAEPARGIRRLVMYQHLRGVLLEGAGRLEEARLAYERALVLESDQPETTVNLGPLLARMGRGAEGLAKLDRLLERYPQAQGALRNRALVRVSLGDARGAREDLEAAHRLLPTPETARALAELAARAGDDAAHAEWSAEALRLGG